MPKAAVKKTKADISKAATQKKKSGAKVRFV